MTKLSLQAFLTLGKEQFNLLMIWVLVGCDRTQQNNNILVIITDTRHLTHNTPHQHCTKQRMLNYDDRNNYINMSRQHDKNILVFRRTTYISSYFRLEIPLDYR